MVARYHLLPAGSADYSSMARIYREHLLERGLPRRANSSGQPLFLDVTASVPTTATVAGVPYRSTAMATGYRDARRILTDLDNPDGLIVRYAGWLAGGTAHRFPRPRLPERHAGQPPRGFCACSTSAGSAGSASFRPWTSWPSTNGAPSTGSPPAGRRRAAWTAHRSGCSTATRPSRRTCPAGPYLISPAALPDLAASFGARYGRMDHPYLGLDRFGLLSFSDYRRGADPERIFDPEETLHVLDETASQLAGDGFRLLIEGANAHLIPHASAVMHVPYRDAAYDIVTRTIPFMQMVLHGSVPYSSEPVNYQADPRTALLRAIESGSSLAFAVIHDAPALPEPLHDVDLYASVYRDGRTRWSPCTAPSTAPSRALQGCRSARMRRWPTACASPATRTAWTSWSTTATSRIPMPASRSAPGTTCASRSGWRGRAHRPRQEEGAHGYLFTLPLMAGIVFFLIMPIAQSISFSVGEIEITEDGYLLHPVGLANFRHVLRVDTFFPRHLAAAVVKLASEAPVVLVFSLICASLLNRPFRGRGVMRTVLFLPVILSSACWSPCSSRTC